MEDLLDEVLVVQGTTKMACNSRSTSANCDVRLRNLQEDDIDDVKNLCREVFPIEYPNQWYSEIISNTQGRYFTLVMATTDTNIIVALLVAEFRTLNQCNSEDFDILAKSFPANTQMAYILSLGVSTKFRNRGLASCLLGHFVQYLTAGQFYSLSKKMCPRISGDTKTKVIYLHVLRENYDAIRFYEKSSFSLHATLLSYYRIDNKMRDGLTYVLYVNGGEPPWSTFEICKIVFGLLLSPIRQLIRLFLTDFRRLVSW